MAKVGGGRPHVMRFPVHLVMVELRAARVKAGWTQEKLAEKIGCDVSSIKNWESGRKVPSVVRVSEYAAAFGLVIMVARD